MKQLCAHCKKSKPLKDFHKSNNTKTGHHTICKICRIRYNTPRASAWNKANPERYKIHRHTDYLKNKIKQTDK